MIHYLNKKGVLFYFNYPSVKSFVLKSPFNHKHGPKQIIIYVNFTFYNKIKFEKEDRKCTSVPGGLCGFRQT